jgi:DNA-binding IclR family transcriptional regulator
MASKVDALERALDILEAFNDGKNALTLKQLAEETGLYKSRILRLTSSFIDRGYMSRDEDGRYHLGPTLWRLGSIYRRGFDLGDRIRPLLSHLVSKINESAAFYVLDGDMRVCLFRHESTHAIRHHVEEGERLPLDKGVAGRVILAFQEEPGEPYEQIRKDGFMNELGERDRDVASVAVPVLGPDQNVIGALSIAGLNSRFNEPERKRAVDVLTNARKKLEAEFAGRTI